MGTGENIDWVRNRLARLEQRGLWPRGRRDLWTDAYGLVLLVSLYDELGEIAYLRRAEWLVDDVETRLTTESGLPARREAGEVRSHPHLMRWLYALRVLTDCDSSYREEAVAQARRIAGRDVDGAEAIDGYVVFRMIDREELADEIAQFERMVERSYEQVDPERELAAGVLLWLTHFFPDEAWARSVRGRCLETLEEMWNEEAVAPFVNATIAIGLQAVGCWSDRVERIHRRIASGSEEGAPPDSPLGPVMACCARFPGKLLGGP